MIDPATAGGLWCGTIPGGLFHSADRGQTWSLNRPLWDDPRRAKMFGGGYDYPGIHSVCVHPSDSNRLAVAISCGGVWESLDHGQSWSLHGRGIRNAYTPPGQEEDPVMQDPHRMVRCPGQPDRLWMQHHNGIFRSDDAGHTWSEIPADRTGPSAFGFGVVVHPRDGDTAWFVPAQVDEVRVPVDGRFVVTRTRDGGQSFDVLTDGLPTGEAYDLVFRHSLAIDAAGTTLALGSTTGSLWVGDTDGDRFEAVSEHLPPIFAVALA